MRTMYQDKLEGLTTQLAAMVGQVSDNMALSTEALLEANLTDAEVVLGSADTLAQEAAANDDAAFELLALQGPVAGDLRQVVSAIRIVNDVRRMSQLALHVANIARRNYPQHTLPEAVEPSFSDMGRIAVDLSRGAQEVLLSRDTDRAEELIAEDETMNIHRAHITSLLEDETWNHGVEAAVDVSLLGRYYERFADHAVEMARRVIYLVSGVLPPAPFDDYFTGYDRDILDN